MISSSSMFFQRRLLRQCLFLLLVATLSGFIFSPPASAQPGGRDVVGIVLGMTPDEVEAVLKARNPSYKFVKVFWRGADGKPSNAVGKLGAALPSGPTDRINTSRGYSRPEAVMVYFTATEGRAYAVYRQVVNKQVGISANEMEAQLTAKYGTPDPFKGMYRLYRRMLDAKGQPNAQCGHRGFEWESAPGGQSRGCGMSIEAQFSDQMAPDTYATFQTWLMDHQAAERDAMALQAKQKAVAAEAASNMQNAARANKPGL
ncbi:hypothetical protein RD110_21875 [Rhodoferax koreense]|uniref:Uncharacterized protein n=1 Tax=Rhodoferax koreensis TaxID=1842727 RepID=A0A1P8K0L9_9BURK|nr:hypothetical protein [Rhodoferax koreense]APW39535.1 hypothetical protein RD110_21875 [Rhodoferax koreense]